MKGYELMSLCNCIEPDSTDICEKCPAKVVACPNFRRALAEVYAPADLQHLVFDADYGTLSIGEAVRRLNESKRN